MDLEPIANEVGEIVKVSLVGLRKNDAANVCPLCCDHFLLYPTHWEHLEGRGGEGRESKPK